MDIQSLQTTIYDFSFIHLIVHYKTVPSVKFLNFPLLSVLMKNSFQNMSILKNTNFTDGRKDKKTDFNTCSWATEYSYYKFVPCIHFKQLI